MATLAHVHDVASDKNCENLCHMELGSGENFERNLVQQQAVKLAKSHLSPQIFSDPKQQALYGKMLDDVVYKTLDGPEEQRVFRAALSGMLQNYPEILSGSEQHMFYCPTAFNFDSRIGKLETSAPSVLEEMQAKLEALQTLMLCVNLLPSPTSCPLLKLQLRMGRSLFSFLIVMRQ